MTAITDRTAIDVWEAGITRHPLDRRLILLAGAYPETSFDRLAALDVQERDWALLDIRRRTFGDLLELYGECPQCGIELEFEASADALLETEPETESVVEADDWQIEFRLPNSLDLARALEAGVDILAACMTGTRRAGDVVTVDHIPGRVRTAVEEAMAAAAPTSDLEFAITCAVCGSEARLLFDPGDFLWDEVSAYARRLMVEIVTLARAFGWEESQILALSSRRRRSYLEAVS